MTNNNENQEGGYRADPSVFSSEGKIFHHSISMRQSTYAGLGGLGLLFLGLGLSPWIFGFAEDFDGVLIVVFVAFGAFGALIVAGCLAGIISGDTRCVVVDGERLLWGKSHNGWVEGVVELKEMKAFYFNPGTRLGSAGPIFKAIYRDGREQRLPDSYFTVPKMKDGAMRSRIGECLGKIKARYPEIEIKLPAGWELKRGKDEGGPSEVVLAEGERIRSAQFENLIFYFSLLLVPFAIGLFLQQGREQQLYEDDLHLFKEGEGESLSLEVERRYARGGGDSRSHYIELGDGVHSESREVSRSRWNRIEQGEVLEGFRIDDRVWVPVLDARDPRHRGLLFGGLCAPSIILAAIRVFRSLKRARLFLLKSDLV